MAEKKYADLNSIGFLTRKIKAKANLESPEFTGEPAAPTPSSDDNSTRIATTAFVKSVVPTEVQEWASAVQKVDAMNDKLYDKILSSSEPTIGQQQSGCAINASGGYTTGQACAGYSLVRYQVSAGDQIVISGTTLDKKYMVWLTSSNSAFSGALRKGPVFGSDITDTEIYEVITIETQETYLFVSKTETMTVEKVGEISLGDITKIKNANSALVEFKENMTNDFNNEVGKTGYDRIANYASLEFLERITPYVDLNSNSSTTNHYVYCIPDLHTRFEALDWHKHIFINSYPNELLNTTAGGLNSKCRFAVSAGDFLYSGGGILSTRSELLSQLDTIVQKSKEWVPYGTYVLPAIGGHDFSNYSDARANHDNKKIGDNLTKNDQLLKLVLPMVNLVKNSVVLTSNGSLSANGNNVDGGCYYAFRTSTDDLYIILDECDHPNYITGTYNGETVKWQMTGINFDTQKFSAKDDDGNTYSNVSFGDFEYVYSRYHNTSYSQNQLNFIINMLTNYGNGRNIWIFNHSGLNNELTDNSGAKAAIKNMIKAYVNRTTYSASGNSESGDMPWEVNVDFSSATGNVVGVFRGHSHRCYESSSGEFKEYTSDTPGIYSNTVSNNVSLFNAFSGDLFQYNTDTKQVKRFHFGRRYAGIDDAPTLEEKVAALVQTTE